MGVVRGKGEGRFTRDFYVRIVEKEWNEIGGKCTYASKAEVKNQKPELSCVRTLLKAPYGSNNPFLFQCFLDDSRGLLKGNVKLVK